MFVLKNLNWPLELDYKFSTFFRKLIEHFYGTCLILFIIVKENSKAIAFDSNS